MDCVSNSPGELVETNELDDWLSGWLSDWFLFNGLFDGAAGGVGGTKWCESFCDLWLVSLSLVSDDLWPASLWLDLRRWSGGPWIIQIYHKFHSFILQKVKLKQHSLSHSPPVRLAIFRLVCIGSEAKGKDSVWIMINMR